MNVNVVCLCFANLSSDLCIPPGISSRILYFVICVLYFVFCILCFVFCVLANLSSDLCIGISPQGKFNRDLYFVF